MDLAAILSLWHLGTNTVNDLPFEAGTNCELKTDTLYIVIMEGWDGDQKIITFLCLKKQPIIIPVHKEAYSKSLKQGKLSLEFDLSERVSMVVYLDMYGLEIRC
ncbi:hypothetical protein ABEW32_17390 [Paenibacillus jamilae]|uniref:hypothetical protein n=1 Tax=Paenibacillus jamilae TaxID=114136 RepID=UPI003D270AAC